MSENDEVDKAFDDVIKAKVAETIKARLGNSVHSYINKTQQSKLIERINKLSQARDAENVDSEKSLRVYLTTEEWINWYDKLLQAIIGVSTLGAGFAFGATMSGTGARDEADKSLQNVRYFMSISWLLFVLSLGWASFTTMFINVNRRWFMDSFNKVLWCDKNNHLFSSRASFVAGTMTLVAQLFPIAAFAVSAKAVQVYYDKVGRCAIVLISFIGVVLIVFWVVQNNYHAICKFWVAICKRWLARATLEQTLEGHTDSVWSVAFSPDGKHIVSGSDDKTVRLWDVTTGTLQQKFKDHTNSVRSVAFSPDGKYIVSGSIDKTIRLWDVTTNTPQQKFKGHTDSVRSVAFSPDGKHIVSGSDDKTVRLWDVTTGTLQQTLEGHTDSVRSVAFSPDGSLSPFLHVKGDWLVNGMMNVLWLPPDYRPNCQAVQGTTIAMGLRSGQVLIIVLSPGLLSCIK